MNIEFDDSKIIIEGDIDPELTIRNIFPGIHPKEESFLTDASLELMINGSIHISDLESLFAWINRNTKTRDIMERTNWRLTLERID